MAFIFVRFVFVGLNFDLVAVLAHTYTFKMCFLIFFSHFLHSSKISFLGSFWWNVCSIQKKKTEKQTGSKIHKIHHRVVYTGESSFRQSNPLSHTMCSAGNRTVVRTIRYPQKVHVYWAFCEKGFGSWTIFTGNLNAARFVQFIGLHFCCMT